MNNSDFAHLHIHNEFSQLDGFGTARAYADKAAKMGYEYLALTNHGNIDGLISWQKACDWAGVKPILGCEGYCVPDLSEKSKKRGHIVLLVKNQTGFNNLCTLMTKANLEGFYYKPRFSFEMLLDYCEGLVISTACAQSFARIFDKRSEEFFENLYDAIDDDLYCEVMPHDIRVQYATNKHAIKLAKRHDLKVIATNDCHYVNRTEYKAQEVLLAIQRKATWSDKNRFRFNFTGLHLRSAREMKRRLRNIDFYKKSYLLNTIEVAEKCSDYRIPKLDINLPRVYGYNITSEKHFLWDLCLKGYEKRYGGDIRENEEYYNRMLEEYKLIIRKKFHRYFIIVWELVQWCKENRIFVGPGRGSVGGSLIAYLLGITSVDPIRFGLIFSRFINEDRIDYPDIDIDFEHTKRHLVKQHLEALYGADNIANVSSFNRMKSRAVVRDVARVFEVPMGEVNRFAKLIDPNEIDAIQATIDNYDEGREFQEEYPDVIKHAKKLEGQVRGYGQHAAALVLSNEPIGDCGRCNLIERDGIQLVNWEKNDTEYVGLMKLDALGLKLLSILSEALRLIKHNHDKDINLERVKLDNKKVLREISDGHTVGLFQLNTWAMTNLIKDMGVETFDHIAAASALVRPGPANSGMTDEYIKRKARGSWEKKDKIYEDITEETYGLLVYQEQVMDVIHKIAGLPYSTADKIRKIIGKKRDPEEFRAYKKKFLKGCRRKKIFDKQEAMEFWRGLQEWAKYGFNKSHSVEYALLGYWCAWLRLYYPTEFICASLTYGSAEKKSEIVEEAYRLGLTLVLPKVGISDPILWVSREHKLYIPFIEVKGIGEKTAFDAAGQKKTKQIQSFFGKKKKVQRHKGKLGDLLDKIGAYSDKEIEITGEIKELFDFRVILNPRHHYVKLYDMMGGAIKRRELDGFLNLEPKVMKSYRKIKTFIHKTNTFEGHDKLASCERCELREECDAPVPPSIGKYNILVLGEAPGRDEDAEGEGFVGRSGQEVWKYLKKKNIKREMFYISNVNKCWPRESRKPNREQIKACRRWLNKELKMIQPILILAFGNTSLQFFTGRKSGIMGMSGQVEWNEKYGAWIVWCLHPAATLHNPDNKSYYIAGMKAFVQSLYRLGMKKYLK